MTTPQELRKLAEQIKRKFGDAGRVQVEPDVLTALLDQIEQLQAKVEGLEKAISAAYGILWHVNNEPFSPGPMYSPEKSAYEARKILRELLTKEERGGAINAARRSLFDAPIERQQP